MQTANTASNSNPTAIEYLVRARRRAVTHRIILGAGFAAVLAVAVPILVVQVAGSAKTYAPDDVAPRPVALVLGAGLRPDGRPSVFLTRRLDMARELYERGTVRVILVSGDNGQIEYDEPTAMFDWLVEAGVPADRVVRDYAGFDTHDSCARANQVFGVTEAIVVTQDYHLPRAVFSCAAAGVDAVGVGVPSTSVSRATGLRYRMREAGASVRAALDALTRRAPVYGGSESVLQDILAKT